MRRFLLIAIGLACGSDKPPIIVPGDPPYKPPPESCDAPNLDDIKTFKPCSTGGGNFGRWQPDALGLPGYDYGLDENSDPQAKYFNTEGLDRRDHWHAFGNERLNVMFVNDGYVEVTTQDRGEEYLNKFDPAQSQFSGGFSYIDDGDEVWPSAYKWRPNSAKSDRHFGMGYAQATTEYRGIRVRHVYSCPPGDAPVVIDDVTIENIGNAAKNIKHIEYWDVTRRPIETSWIVSGTPLDSVPASVRKDRDARNQFFTETVSYDAASKLLGIRRTYSLTKPPVLLDDPSAIDYYPHDPFLVALVGDVNDVQTEVQAFFGSGGVTSPTGARASGQGTQSGVKGSARSGDGQPRMFALRSDFLLGPTDKKQLRFAYGYAPQGKPYDIDPTWATRDIRADVSTDVRKHLFYFGSDRDFALHRELAWHSSQIEASVGRRDYWGTHVVPQGSAYLYLHGADGAARDLGLFSVPLVYTHASLAKEELRLMMGIHIAQDKRFSYAFQGNGMLDDALGIHNAPSDLDLFFLWGLVEYVFATGDTAFLDEKAPYYPKLDLPNALVSDHVRDAVRHLFDKVGTSDHGLIRLQTGDWSDGIVFEAPDRNVAILKGESVPNTQMALWVLPLVADLVDASDPALASEIRAKVTALKSALPSAWAGSYYGRAFFGDGKLAHSDRVDLEAQVWALIADSFATPDDRQKTLAAIAKDLDDPSPGGATLQPKGQVWPAISCLLTWGYSLYDEGRAMTHLAKNTMFSHALAFPSIWYGIWSGPDGLNGKDVAPPSAEGIKASGPGETWFSAATPMTDFPVMNNNQHAMPLLAALRVAGITPTLTGLSISPHVPTRNFTLSTELIDLSQRGGVLSGAYRPKAARKITVFMKNPITKATINGVDTPFAGNVVVLPIGQSGGTFEVRE